MKQKITAFVLAAALLLGAVVIQTAAALQSGVSVSKTELKIGDTVTVTLTVPGTNTLISDMTLKVSFNNSVFEVTEFATPALNGASKMASTVSEANTNGFFAATYSSQNYEADVSIASGVTMSATLSVKENAPDGSYDFNVGNDFAVSGLDGMGMPVSVMSYSDVNVKSVSVTVSSAAPTYTVSFNAGEGTGNMDSVSGVSGSYNLPSCDFNAPGGKQFKAWSVGGQEKAVGDPITVTGNTEVTALWEDIPAQQIAAANVTVTEPAAGAKPSFTVASDDPGKYTATVSDWYVNEPPYTSLGPNDIFESGKSYALRVAFSANQGYEFTGETVFTVNGKTTGCYGSVGMREVSFAIPVPTYTVSFNAGEGTGNMDSVSGVSGSYNLPSCDFTAPGGKQFKAWSVGGQEKAVGDPITVSSDTEVTALWEDIPHYHSLSLVPAVPATCTTAGNKAYYTCSGCEKWFEDEAGKVEISDHGSVVIAAKGHTAGAAVHENEVAAGCESQGSYDEVVYCSVNGCGAELSRVTKYTNALGHNWGEWTQTKAPTETEKGEETRTCQRDQNHTEKRDVPELGHTHDLSLVPAKEPTETENGNKAYYTCSGCEKWFEDEAGKVEISDHGSVIIPATGSPKPQEYKITDGEAAKWKKGSGRNLLFVSDADFDNFVSVRIDGAVIDASNYTAEAGGTRITLKAAYLESLAVGTHTVTLVSNDGEATTRFTVLAADIETPVSPQTGEDGHLGLLILLMLFSLVGILLIPYIVKRKKHCA